MATNQLQRIGLRTTQNIILNITLAGAFNRVLAYAIDLGIILLGLSIVSIFSSLVQYIVIIYLFFALTFYHLIFEIFNVGQSPGKKIMKLRVVAMDGSAPALQSLILRWAFRLPDILLSAGAIGFLTIYSSTYGQRIGDLLAGTTVMKIDSNKGPTIQSLLSLNERNKEILFPEMKIYNDDEMVIVKKALERYQEHPTAENKRLLEELYQRIVSDTGAKPGQLSKRAFLKEAVDSYILITR